MWNLYIQKTVLIMTHYIYGELRELTEEEKSIIYKKGIQMLAEGYRKNYERYEKNMDEYNRLPPFLKAVTKKPKYS